MALKLRTKVNFPATVTATGGLKVVKNNGAWTVSPDFSQLAALTGSAVTDPSQKQVWLYDPAFNQYNVLTLAGLGDALYLLTSSSSNSIGTGAKTFATQANKDVGAGSFVLIASNANPANFMAGQVTAYSGTTLTVNVTAIGGSGMYAGWTIRASGVIGATGATGAGYSATSATGNTIANTGAKTFAVGTDLAYSAGARVRATESADPPHGWKASSRLTQAVILPWLLIRNPESARSRLGPSTSPASRARAIFFRPTICRILPIRKQGLTISRFRPRLTR